MMNLNSELGGATKVRKTAIEVAKLKSIMVSLPYQKTKCNGKLKISHRGGKFKIFVQIQSQLPFIGMKFIQKEARKAKPTALNWDDESSKVRL